MKIFLDDQWFLPERYPGDGWCCAQTVQQAKELLDCFRGSVTHLSLDGDLGDEQIEQGPDLVIWLCEQFYTECNDFWPTESLTVHSRNPAKREAMLSYAENRLYNPRPEIVQR